MARLRKAGRIWQRPTSRSAAQRVIVEAEDGLFEIDPAKIFRRTAPLEVEIGAGRGDFIIDRASKSPDRNFLAVELSGVVSRMLAVRCGSAEVANLRVVRMDARPLAALMLPARSVNAFHIYFPDPWPKERHRKHRLFTPDFAAGIARTLEPDGRLFVATDVSAYADAIFATLAAAGFRRVDEPVPGAYLTGFARKFIAIDKPVFSGAFITPHSNPDGG